MASLFSHYLINKLILYIYIYTFFPINTNFVNYVGEIKYLKMVAISIILLKWWSNISQNWFKNHNNPIGGYDSLICGRTNHTPRNYSILFFSAQKKAIFLYYIHIEKNFIAIRFLYSWYTWIKTTIMWNGKKTIFLFFYR